MISCCQIYTPITLFFMKTLYFPIVFTLSTIIFISCSIGGGVSDNFTETRVANPIIQSGSTKPYEIGTVDTAFKLI